jgi:hypothetical protein
VGYLQLFRQCQCTNNYKLGNCDGTTQLAFLLRYQGPAKTKIRREKNITNIQKVEESIIHTI